ncbi:hypothetical protein CNMCM5793_003301 [Aspergillus hiratsukae]|uniref:Cytochrome P450 n=1 Tax=Aspergillus hiratsukae TaxID=1194566 RepID=A0A8H6PE48_9EURO|nr:hypothetical protein CNMCM5793_003301 [Aspergillus hiratsukae]
MLESEDLSPFRVGLVTLVCGIFLVYIFYDRYPSAPGPRWAKYSRIWYFWKVWEGEFERENIRLHKKYGAIVRLGPKDYSIDDPEAAKIIYGPGSRFEKSSWYTVWSPTFLAHVNLFSLRDSKSHAAERRKLSGLYSMSTLLRYEPYVDNCVSILRDRLDEAAKHRVSLSMNHWMQCFAFDVIGEITFSKRFGFLDRGEDISGIMKSLETTASQSTMCGIYSFLTPFVFGLISTGLSAVVNFMTKEIHGRLKSSLEGREKESRDAPDFLTKLAKLHREDPNAYSYEHVFSGCAQNIFAGSDTTSITLNAIFYYLLRNEQVLRRLQAEIDEAIQSGQASDPITFTQAQRLPYLQAVIKEAMRMHPATGLPMWRVVPEGGAVLSGMAFPAGTVVGINSWVAHYNTTVFGEDAALFRPERWLKPHSSPEQLSSMEKYFMAFGMGSRTCIGKNISILEISKLVPQLIRHYDIRLATPEWTCRNQWFPKQSNFEVAMSMREVS